MTGTITYKEIEEFLDKSLNFERKELEEKEYGKKHHEIRQFVYEDGVEDVGSKTIFLSNDLSKNFHIGGICLDKSGVIYYIKIDSAFTTEGRKRHLYVGTDIDKELNDRFLGKKLVDSHENK